MDIIQELRDKAIKKNKTIIFPETEDIRTLHAAKFLSEHKICNVILVGDQKTINDKASSEGIELTDKLTYITPGNDPDFTSYVKRFYERRKHKGLTLDQASEILQQPLFYSAAIVAAEKADGCVAGAVNTTGNVLKAAIQVIGLKEGSDIVSSTFLMSLPDGRVFTYGDCAVVPYPTSEQLASIALDSSITHKKLTGESPIVAMLSFSTKGSARHERVDLVTEALNLAKQKDPELPIDGEMQFDAALIPAIGERKAPGSSVAGKANVFIFPNLDAGNISYKITERLAGAFATGPIIQGLARPMNDLSRGCSWEDIVNTAAVCSLLSE